MFFVLSAKKPEEWQLRAVPSHKTTLWPSFRRCGSCLGPEDSAVWRGPRKAKIGEVGQGGGADPGALWWEIWAGEHQAAGFLLEKDGVLLPRPWTKSLPPTTIFVFPNPSAIFKINSAFICTEKQNVHPNLSLTKKTKCPNRVHVAILQKST